MNAAHTNKKIPAHRVVNRNGLLTGKNHFETPATMKNRLEKEGIKVKKDQVQDFKRCSGTLLLSYYSALILV
jgi:methylated-DNA-protein-cysteine methyltransferase-like protein